MMNVTSDSSKVHPAEMTLVRAWADRLTAAAPSQPAEGHAERYSLDIPASFTCGERSSRDWVQLGNATRQSGQWQDGKRIHLLQWRDAETSLACTMELTEFEEFPAMEWIVRLRNEGSSETAPIANFKALDMFWTTAAADVMPELCRSLGSDGRHDDFQYIRDEMRQSMWDTKRTIRMDSATNTAFRKARNGSPPFLMTDGRTSATWLPFFNLRTGSDGLLCALGWSGQWFAEFAYDGQGKTDISAGMEHLELKLQPGEEIRSPRILVAYWNGTPLHAHNMLRQLLLKHFSPQDNGQAVEMPICNGSWGGTPTQGHLDAIARIAQHQLPYDYYWVDAGWYGTSTKPCPTVFEGEWGITGDWRVNRNYHPDGLKPISDAAHKAGMKFLLWLEPERAKHGTPITLEHPEWFLKLSDAEPKQNDDLLLNIGIPEAREWVIETVSTLITENGIDCYREDFNIDPCPFWAHADAPGRKGLTEMRFVEGLYIFWDELRRRHPGLLIDNCASGGRRLDMETIRRSVALWRTDYNCFPYMNPDALQLHTAGLNLWLPLNATSPLSKPGDTYQTRSAYSAGLVLNVDDFGLRDCQVPDFPWDWFRLRLEEAKRLRPYFLGDFYPLTPCVVDSEGWMAYQLHIPETQQGAVLAFRRPMSPVTAASFQLHSLEESGKYEFECADSGQTCLLTGSELMTNGLPLSAPAPRTSILRFYRRLP